MLTDLVFITFWIITFVKWSFSKFWGICHNFTQVLLWKHVIFVLLLFHLKKNRLKTLLTNTTILVKYLRSFEVQPIKYQVSKWALDNAIILSLSLFDFYGFHGFYHSFVYDNIFSSCRDTLGHLLVSEKYFVLGETMLYFDQFTDFERFPNSEWRLYHKNYLQKNILQNILSSHQKFGRYFLNFFWKIDFAVEW